MTKQDHTIKGNLDVPRHDGGRLWSVPSASSTRVYSVNLERAEVGDYDAACNCRATGRCWHIDAAALREQLAIVAANCRRYYAAWELRELQAEDLRLRVIASADGWGPFLRQQYTALGNAIAAALEETHPTAA